MWPKCENIVPQMQLLQSILLLCDVENKALQHHSEIDKSHFVTSCKRLKNWSRWLHGDFIMESGNDGHLRVMMRQNKDNTFWITIVTVTPVITCDVIATWHQLVMLLRTYYRPEAFGIAQACAVDIIVKLNFRQNWIERDDLISLFFLSRRASVQVSPPRVQPGLHPAVEPSAASPQPRESSGESQKQAIRVQHVRQVLRHGQQPSHPRLQSNEL